MWNAVWSIAGKMGLLAGALSITLLVQHSLDVGLAPALQIVLDYYEWFRSALMSPLQPIAELIAAKIAQFLNLNIELSEHWGDVFVLMVLYLGARAKAYWDTGARTHAAIRFVLGVLISFVTAILAGTWSEVGVLSGLMIVMTVVIGLFVFDVFDASWAALAYRRPDQTWIDEFRRYLGFSLPTIAVAVVALVLSVFLFLVGVIPSSARLGSTSLLIFAFALALYWAWRGWALSGQQEYREESETRWARFRRSSTTRIAILMLMAMTGSACFFAMNAGHALFVAG
ncbi:hypothetical protein [Paramylibacter ulvae]|uniref:hypothetical protein n=1 Tax=Paramylibacter ulvae TaxID=1651968 RepID=UPI001E37E7FB|nr:hypothetical protein [Amylibacter ulvae]